MDIEGRVSELEASFQEFICTMDKRLSSLERQMCENSDRSQMTSLRLSQSMEKSLKNIIPKVDTLLSKIDNTSPKKSVASSPSCNSAIVRNSNGLFSSTERKKCFLEAARNGYEEELEFLISVGIDLNTRDVDGSTALSLASANGHSECVSLLLESGADRNAKDINRRNALHRASHNGHVQCVLVLLDVGLDVNSRDEYESTPLILAAGKGHSDCISLLIERGADKEAKNRMGVNALWFATKFNYTECLSLLRPLPSYSFLHLTKPLYWRERLYLESLLRE